MKPAFTKKLLDWNKQQNNREMPWKGEKDPYKIWLSEIILQQTRVEQGWEYYERFIKTFPTVKKLAAAPDEKVFKLWEGLGYYSRCRNLLASARWIVEKNNGRFPDTYEMILSLKGVGPYTAAAISSFAFQLPHAVVDGNVQRVLSRYFGITTPIDSTQGKKIYDQLAQALLDTDAPGEYNQAIMDFGAVICKPQSPLCEQCYQKKDCVALSINAIKELPVKSKSIQIKERWFDYFILIYKKQLYIRKRTTKDIWEQLNEFVLLESTDGFANAAITKKYIYDIVGNGKVVARPIGKPIMQKLSHQHIHGRFTLIELEKTPRLPEGFEKLPVSKISTLAFPKLINTFLESHSGILFGADNSHKK